MKKPGIAAQPLAGGAGAYLFPLFRVTALIEGITTILLFCVAMPIKYAMDDPSWVAVIGPVHGYAFLAYIVIMLVALRGPGWTGWDMARAGVASLIPFGTFLNDPYLVRRRAEIVAA